MSKDDQQKILKLTTEEIDALKDRLAKKDLKPEDYDTLAASLTVMALLRLKLTKSGAALNLWLKRIFGLKTEKNQIVKKTKTLLNLIKINHQRIIIAMVTRAVMIILVPIRFTFPMKNTNQAVNALNVIKANLLKTSLPLITIGKAAPLLF